MWNTASQLYLHQTCWEGNKKRLTGLLLNGCDRTVKPFNLKAEKLQFKYQPRLAKMHSSAQDAGCKHVGILTKHLVRKLNVAFVGSADACGR